MPSRFESQYPRCRAVIWLDPKPLPNSICLSGLERPECEAHHVSISPLKGGGDGSRVAVHQSERDDESGNGKRYTRERGEGCAAQ